MVKHEAFELVMFLLIGVQCVVMALERPGMEKAPGTHVKARGPRVSRLLRAGGFVEILRVRAETVSAQNACQPPGSVHRALRHPGDLPHAPRAGWAAIRSLRILRAIRPLRALTKSPGMRMVLKSVALSVGAMANVSAVLLLVFVVFGSSWA